MLLFANAHGYERVGGAEVGILTETHDDYEAA
jgi:hypothetical protein